MKKSILFVDDEHQILKSINRLFIDTNYDVYLASSGDEALRVLSNINIDMVISDMRMPHMSGFQLLEIVKEKYPKVLRLVLSGYAEAREVFGALQNNLAKTYLLKPWDNQELLGKISEVFAIEEIMKDKEILDYINNLHDIPSLPAFYQKLCTLINKEADVKDIVHVIENDPAMASKILRIANSAFNGAKTGSIKQAILYLGLTNIKNIVLTSSILNEMRSKTLMYNKSELSKHSCLCNKLVSLFYKNLLKKPLLEDAMSAGLLHDIGIITLINNYEEEYMTILKQVEKAKISFIESEKQVMKYTHQDIGGYLLNWWELPKPIVEAALYHHNPLDERIENKELVCIVHLADHYSWKLLGENRISRLDQNVLDYFNISENTLESIFKD